MNEQDGTKTTTLQRPTANDKEGWKAYWKAQGQEWRSEPEIDAERQQFLNERRNIEPDRQRGIYSFKDVEPKLTRADIEWLLATHEHGLGPVNWNDETQRKRRGLDLRGAELRKVDLSRLPLSRMNGGTPMGDAPPEQLEAMILHLEGAKLRGAHLEEAELSDCHLEQADLSDAHLEQAHLYATHLERALLTNAHLEQAQLSSAHLEKTGLYAVHLEEAYLNGAYLEGAYLRGAYLKQTDLSNTHLERADLQKAHLEQADLSEAHLEGANLSGCFFDGLTNLFNILPSNGQNGGVSIVDIHWSDVNVAVVDWSSLISLGDEQEARKRYRYRRRRPIKKDKNERLRQFQTGVRANRQLAVVLRNQGLNEEADRFAYRAQKLQRVVLRRQGLEPGMNLWQRLRKFSSYTFSLFLDLLAGYGYQPAKTLLWYLLVIGGFAIAYALFGHLPLLPDTLVFSFMSFHGRGFFPSLSGETNLHNPLVMLAAAEAVIGLLIEISLIATFTQRYFAR